MDILCISGVAPGPVSVSVAHGGQVHQLAMEVARHHAGGWLARRPGAAWGLRCHSVQTAVLLEAAETIEGPELTDAEAPMAGLPHCSAAGVAEASGMLATAPWHKAALSAVG